MDCTNDAPGRQPDSQTEWKVEDQLESNDPSQPSEEDDEEFCDAGRIHSCSTTTVHHQFSKVLL
jgi:hypothetical protein